MVKFPVHDFANGPCIVKGLKDFFFQHVVARSVLFDEKSEITLSIDLGINHIRVRLETFSDLAVYGLEFLEVELHELDLVEIAFLNLVQEWRELLLELIYRRIQFINRLLIIIFRRCRILLGLGAPIPEVPQHLLL